MPAGHPCGRRLPAVAPPVEVLNEVRESDCFTAAARPVAAIQSTHAETTWLNVSRRRSAKAPPAGGVFHEIGRDGNADVGFGHLGADLAGSGDVLWRQDASEVCDQ
jgi:hypothetical protein